MLACLAVLDVSTCCNTLLTQAEADSGPCWCLLLAAVLQGLALEALAAPVLSMQSFAAWRLVTAGLTDERPLLATAASDRPGEGTGEPWEGMDSLRRGPRWTAALLRAFYARDSRTTMRGQLQHLRLGRIAGCASTGVHSWL